MLRFSKKAIEKANLPLFYKKSGNRIIRESARNAVSVAHAHTVGWPELFEDIEKTRSFFKKLKNDKLNPVEKVKEDAAQFMADIYELALKEAKLKLQNFEFSKASVIFYKMIESIPKLTLKNDPLNKILAEAYLQEGIILSKGNIKEGEKAFEFFKIAADLDPKNELTKEKLLEMQYERGEMYTNEENDSPLSNPST